MKVKNGLFIKKKKRRTLVKLADKRYCITLKTGVVKLDLNNLVNVPIGLDILKTKVDDLDVDKLKKIFPADLKKLIDVLSNENVEKIEQQI